MDMLDRLLRHDAWTTRRLMELCVPLSDTQLDQRFPIGFGTLRQTFIHVVRNLEVWTALIAGSDRINAKPPVDTRIATLIERFDDAWDALYAVARRITDEGRLDRTFVDRLDDPPWRKSNGAGILHIATHGMHHRAQILYMLRQLQVDDVPEGDALSWEQQHVGGWEEP